jgi:hypothetical protein
MFSKWSSPNGVDFSYFGPGFNGSGFLYGDREFDDSPAHFTIYGFAGKFGTAHLHRILWLTRLHFHGLQLRCLYRGSQIEQLDQLSREGSIVWRFLETKPGSPEVEMLSITKPARGRPYVKGFFYRLLDWLRESGGEKS